jgi:hypothetical protein
VKKLLSVIELGGYEDFTELYKSMGYEVTQEITTRKAISRLKRTHYDVVVAEFNYQHTFRDRLSNLESVIAGIQKQNAKCIVIYEKEFENHLSTLRQQFNFDAELSLPISPADMQAALETVAALEISTLAD